jgi:hypothetical protein
MRLGASIVLGVALALGASGCVSGADYRGVELNPTLSLSRTGTVAVCVHDRRPYVVSGEVDPNYVGILRTGLGIPSTWTTASELPLAEDMAHSIRQALDRAGLRALTVVAPPDESPDRARLRASDGGGQAALYIVLEDWRSDTWTDVTLDYHLTLQVLGRHGDVLAEVPLRGVDDLGTSDDPHARASTQCPLAWKRKADFLLSSSGVTTALERCFGGSPGSPPPGALGVRDESFTGSHSSSEPLVDPLLGD